MHACVHTRMIIDTHTHKCANMRSQTHTPSQVGHDTNIYMYILIYFHIHASIYTNKFIFIRMQVHVHL